jgi:hypothetical protein
MVLTVGTVKMLPHSVSLFLFCVSYSWSCWRLRHCTHSVWTFFLNIKILSINHSVTYCHGMALHVFVMGDGMILHRGRGLCEWAFCIPNVSVSHLIFFFWSSKRPGMLVNHLFLFPTWTLLLYVCYYIKMLMKLLQFFYSMWPDYKCIIHIHVPGQVEKAVMHMVSAHSTVSLYTSCLYNLHHGQY